ncbi:MAG: TrkA C-terminal domain-containing protein, partial [Oscillospiraceae bacterium]
MLNHGNAAISEIELPINSALDGKMLVDIKLPELFNIVSITRGEALIIPRGQSILRSGDKLLIISENSTVHK